MNCPHCNSRDIRESRNVKLRDAVHRLRGERTLRCRACWHHFYSLEPFPESLLRQKHPLSGGALRLQKARRKKRRRQLAIVMSVFAASFFLFWLFLRFLMMDKRELSGSVGLNHHVLLSAEQLSRGKEISAS
jgi:hypothetical protein